jgi:hypothetical protein
MNTQNDGTTGDVARARSDTNEENGVQANWLINVRGQYEMVSAVSPSAGTATLDENFDFEGTGYVASPYFGQTWGGSTRNKGLVGVHKTRFTTELKASYTVTPYTKGTYTISSVQSATQATLTAGWSTTFTNVEFQIGNIPVSGAISYPDTSKQDVYGSWPPNPTKFTTELKDGYTIQCDSCGGDNVRVKQIYNDQHMYVDPRFTKSFVDKTFKIKVGPRGTGLVSGAASGTRLEGSDPCRVANNEPCYENTRFLTELRVNDQIAINSNTSGTIQTRTVDSIADSAHLQLKEPLASMLFTNSKFKIKTFHSAPYTYARKANGGLSSPGGSSTTVYGYNSSKFTQNLMAGYAIIAKIPSNINTGDVDVPSWDSARRHIYEKRTIVSIDSATQLTIDSPFSNAFGTNNNDPSTTTYNYESCPSLTYENFDLRTENGHGVISSDGTNHVYDNVQYSKVTTTLPKNPSHPYNALKDDKAGLFTRFLKVGYTITADSVTRTITKIVDNTLLHVDRAFKEGVLLTDYSYRYSVRKTGDFHLHWKPATVTGDYHQVANATDAHIHARNMIATAADPVTYNGVTQPQYIQKQDAYLQYPPVCYNSGRCVPKTSHSLVGMESMSVPVKVLSSTLPHQTAVADYVQIEAPTDPTAVWGFANEFVTNCKPKCTVTVRDSAVAVTGGHATLGRAETRAVARRVNSTFIQTESPFTVHTANAAITTYTGLARYVTGTGTVTTDAATTGTCTTVACRTVTGASKETKTKFNSEFASGWTISIGCGGASCGHPNKQDTTCTTDAQCLTLNGKTVSGTCSGGYCAAEIKNISAVASDTRLSTTQAFTKPYSKVDYTIGMIPGLGLITNSESSRIVNGNDNTRFLEQLKVGYTITAGTDTRTIHAISSNRALTLDQAFSTTVDGTPSHQPYGITTASSYKFSGKKGTGEVTVASGSPKQVDGTSDVTQTQFLNELAVGYLFMLGEDYKVVSNIISNTELQVDSAFLSVYTSNDYNYESCWLSLGPEGGVEGVKTNADYTNKKVYVEDACEIKPGCCGFKVSSVVFPDRFAYYKIRPPHTNMNIRVVVKTTEDNVDVVAKKGSVPTTSSYDYKSVRESNPWALTVPQDQITCPSFGGNAMHPPNNCEFWYIGVRGDNRYPQKTGASEYDLYVYTEFDFPNFLCSDAQSTAGDNKCQWLGISKNEDANMATNDDSQAVMRLTPAQNQAKGASYYSTKVHLYDGFETTFQFRMHGFSVGCNSVLYPSGFCGGGDGFAFVIQKHDDRKIGCTGAALGYAEMHASKQGNDWSRHRCTSVGGDAEATCDLNDNGILGTCVQGALCTVTNAKNGGCGTDGSCDFQGCTTDLSMVLAVEFDTWNNLKLHDPKQGVSRWWINATEFVGYNDNHVAIFSSNGVMQSDHALNEHFAATPSIPNLADGRNHSVKIKYWPQLIDFGKATDGDYHRINYKLRGALHSANIATCGDCEDTNTPTKYPAPDACYACKLHNNATGNLAVFIDDMKRPVLQTAISLRKGGSDPTVTCHDEDRDRCILDELGNAYIGFTAATGGERAGGRLNDGTHVPYGGATAYSNDLNTRAQNVENAQKMLGAAQNHEILNWKFCNQIGCVAI